ncbi:hypothetical protein AB0B40_35985 [Streptomyces sp. NPDC042638]|uniref:hypothetical protein n=1 Tax=Streptomyces sp. NPDC042638 TaxID=3154333 RepID=UPI0033CCA56B
MAQLDYEDMDHSLGLWSTLVKAHQAPGRLGEPLAEEVAQGRIAAGELHEDAIADALSGPARLTRSRFCCRRATRRSSVAGSYRAPGGVVPGSARRRCGRSPRPGPSAAALWA